MSTPTHARIVRDTLALFLAFALIALSLAGCDSADKLASSANSNMQGGVTLSAETSACMPPPNELYPDYTAPTEEYNQEQESGFVSTATHPLSTLSADVDTASYCNLRRMIHDGSGPSTIPTGAVRTEEMLNYFDYQYAAPHNNNLFGTTTQLADCPWNPDTKLLIMGFATESAAYESSAGSNLTFLIDTSGSMDSPDKLPLLQDAFAQLVDGLTERDRVSIVTYSGEERVVLEGASGADKRRITRAIDSLHAGGSTNGEAGLKTAYRLAEETFIEGGVNRIIMASDGDLNVGMTSESDLHDFVDEKRASGVYLSVLGFGTGNYKDNNMETLADHGNGAYHYIDCLEEAKRVFGKNLNANLVPLANDVKIQIEFNPEQVQGYRLIGYENRALADEDFKNDTVDAGEVGAGHAFTVAYEVVPTTSSFEVAAPALKYEDNPSNPDEAPAHGDEWLTCTVRYRPAGHTETVEQTQVVDASAEVAEPSEDWRFAAAVIEVSMLVRNSEYVGSATYESALALIDATNDPSREEFANLTTALARSEERARAVASSEFERTDRAN